LSQTDATIHLEVFLGATRAITLSCFIIALTGQFIAAADAITVAGCRCGLDRHECHSAFPPEAHPTLGHILEQGLPCHQISSTEAATIFPRLTYSILERLFEFRQINQTNVYQNSDDFLLVPCTNALLSDSQRIRLISVRFESNHMVE